MITFRPRLYSMTDTLIKNITDKLDRERIEDYDVSDEIPRDCISIGTDLKQIKIFVPAIPKFELSQFDIEDQIRDIIPYMRTTVHLDRNVYIVTLDTRVNETQYFKIIKSIVENQEFCMILNNK